MTLATLTDPTGLPPFAALTPETILPALGQAIADQDAVIDALVRTRPTSFAAVWMPLERAANAIDALWSAVSHLKSVADSPTLRTVHAEGNRLLVAAGTRLRQNRDLYDVLVALAATPGFADLPLADRAAVEHAIRDFTLAGVALEPEQRARYADISLELSQLATDFGSAVLDATDAWFEQITDPAQLAGVPEADLAMFADAARAKGIEGWVVTLHHPSVRAILTFADDRDLRARLCGVRHPCLGSRAAGRPVRQWPAHRTHLGAATRAVASARLPRPGRMVARHQDGAGRDDGARIPA